MWRVLGLMTHENRQNSEKTIVYSGRRLGILAPTHRISAFNTRQPTDARTGASCLYPLLDLSTMKCCSLAFVGLPVTVPRRSWRSWLRLPYFENWTLLLTF